MKTIIPISLFEIDILTSEATGTVHNFCSHNCINSFSLGDEIVPFRYAENHGKCSTDNEVCAHCGDDIVDQDEEKRSEYQNFRKNVIQFATEDEPKFVPDERFIYECWVWGAYSGAAATDCVAHFKRQQA